MLVPFLVGVTVLLAVAAVAVWVGLEFRTECRARRNKAA